MRNRVVLSKKKKRKKLNDAPPIFPIVDENHLQMREQFTNEGNHVIWHAHMTHLSHQGTLARWTSVKGTCFSMHELEPPIFRCPMNTFLVIEVHIPEEILASRRYKEPVIGTQHWQLTGIGVPLFITCAEKRICLRILRR